MFFDLAPLLFVIKTKTNPIIIISISPYFDFTVPYILFIEESDGIPLIKQSGQDFHANFRERRFRKSMLSVVKNEQILTSPHMVLVISIQFLEILV